MLYDRVGRVSAPIFCFLYITNMSCAPSPLADLVLEYAIGGTEHFLWKHIKTTSYTMLLVRALPRARRFLEVEGFHSPAHPTLRQVVEHLNFCWFSDIPTRRHHLVKPVIVVRSYLLVLRQHP